MRKMIWKWLRKGKLKRETESFLIDEQSNAIRTYYIEMKFDISQQYTKRSLCVHRWNY